MHHDKQCQQFDAPAGGPPMTMSDADWAAAFSQESTNGLERAGKLRQRSTERDSAMPNRQSCFSEPQSRIVLLGRKLSQSESSKLPCLALANAREIVVLTCRQLSRMIESPVLFPSLWPFENVLRPRPSEQAPILRKQLTDQDDMGLLKRRN